MNRTITELYSYSRDITFLKNIEKKKQKTTKTKNTVKGFTAKVTLTMKVLNQTKTILEITTKQLVLVRRVIGIVLKTELVVYNSIDLRSNTYKRPRNNKKIISKILFNSSK
jgi:hypothetical protein